MRPGVARLLMDLKIRLCNVVRVQNAIDTFLRVLLRCIDTYEFGVNSAVDHRVRHMSMGYPCRIKCRCTFGARLLNAW